MSQGDGDSPGTPSAVPDQPEAVTPEPVVVLAPTPEEEAEQIARELWPTRAEPTVADDGEGLADLWRTPLKIVTLEDLQQAATEAGPAADARTGPRRRRELRRYRPGPTLGF